MDDVDRALLQALRANARASFAELGRLVSLSGPSVQERVRRLEERGIITGYHAAIDPRTLGFGVAAVIGIYLSDAADSDQVAQALSQLTEIEDCWSVAGEESLLAKVRAVDVAELEQVLSRLRGVDGISRTRTTVVLSTKWEDRVAMDQLAP